MSHLRTMSCVLAVSAVCACGAPQQEPAAVRERAVNGFSFEAQSAGARSDGLVLRSIRHATHPSFYRLVFDIGLAGGQPARDAPSATALYRALDHSIELTMLGVRDDLTGNLPLETENGEPFGKPVPIDGPSVSHVARLLVLDDSAVAYRIKLEHKARFRLLALPDPARIVVDVEQ